MKEIALHSWVPWISSLAMLIFVIWREAKRTSKNTPGRTGPDFKPMALGDFLVAPETIKGLIRKPGAEAALYVLDHDGNEHMVAGPATYTKADNLLYLVLGPKTYNALTSSVQSPIRKL